MKNVAVLTVQLDTVAEKYETELIYADRIEKDTKSIYISPSPKVEHIVTKIAVGKEAITALERLERAYLNKNEKLKRDKDERKLKQKSNR